MKKKPSILLFLLLLIFSCNQKEELELGAYYGQFPCADCPGINLQLELNEDQTYTIKSFYLDRGVNLYEEKGSFKIQADTILILDSKENEAQLYHIGKQKLTMLDVDGEEIESSMAIMYVLRKNKPKDFTLFPIE